MEVPGVSLNQSSATVLKQQAKKKSMQVAMFAIAFGLMPILFLMSSVMFIDATAPKVEAPEVSSASVNNARGKAAAISAIESWISRTPSPLPGGFIVSWDGFRERESPVPFAENEDRPTYIEQVHSFTLMAGEQVYDSQVLVLVDGDFGVKTIGTPTLLPRPTESTSSWVGEVPWFGYRSISPNDSVVTAVDTWAEAYASGSPRRLKQITGDGGASRSYVPMTGVKDVKANIVSAGVLAPATAQEDENWVEPTTILVRVELTFHWEGEEAPKSGDNAAPVTFDLLVIDTHTANAKVVSWGGAGSGPMLSEYSVALDGVKLREPQNKQLSDEDPESTKNASGDVQETEQETE